MKKEMIVRAWKDPAFRASLSAEQRAELPESPSGRPMSELDEADLGHAVGGVPRTWFGCIDYSFNFIRCPPSSFRLTCPSRALYCDPSPPEM
ncbi:mersacidin/lichenicidin family type 2 lantibiotic [Archangium gephyra]|uniref:mersacidin/lichenicidin family type 2 lantibiotic n=1 Tax=Archangium gephyra TaxID=48 RepID=UPI0035D3F2A1